ncbi:MAG: hypothetical protein QG652_1550 [Pseudomonadota bacterium]|nr:hypothetical protein [Pseudomonadota bacterium]
MRSIHQVMSHDHKRCDDMFVEAQKSAARKDWASARQYADLFIRNTLQHFHHEETVLFPAFEQTTGMTQGPTTVMREEHRTMRDLLDDLHQAVTNENQSRFLGIAETLYIFMQQHNMKEENVLYPMIDQHCPRSDMDRLCNLHSTTSDAA